MSFSTQTPFEAKPTDTLIGLGVIISCVVIIFAFIYWEEEKAKENWLYFHTNLSKSFGITKNTPIKLAGIAIGRVTNVRLTQDARVHLDIILSRDYQQHYVADSKLSIDGNFGLGNVITGSSLVFKPGNEINTLNENAQVDFVEPSSMSDKLESIDIAKLAKTVERVLESVDSVLHTLKSNQHNITKIMNNAALSSEAMVTSVQNAETITQASLGLVTQTTDMLKQLDTQIQSSMNNANGLISNTNTAVLETTALLTSMQKVAQQTPDTLASAEAMMTEIESLTRQIGNHWLLSNGKTKVNKPVALSPIYPQDSRLYQTEAETP